MNGPGSNVRIVGRGISSGLVIGKAFIYRERLEGLGSSFEIEQHEVDDELARIECATRTVTEDLRTSARRIEADTTTKLAAIFEAHEAMLSDPGLREEITRLIKDELISATHALARVFRRRERKFRALSDQSQRQLADDVADLGRRLLREMAGITTTSLEKMPEGRVLVARRLLPSDTVALRRRAVRGIVVEFGGPGTHAALLAEALGIPTVAEIANATEVITDNDSLVVDGSRGEILINPDVEAQIRYNGEIESEQVRYARVIELAGQPARTRDGTTVVVQGNVGCREDVLASVKHGADGVGLYRLEQYYLSRKTPPGPEELLAELQDVFEPMKGKPVTVRLLDLGGDKPLPFLNFPVEDNPFLGRRGVRLLLQYPEMLDIQLEALLHFAKEHDVHVLVPMVTLAEEMASVRERFAKIAKKLGHPKLPPLGAMIETPAAALCLADIKAHADFFSVGTNDLTQYTMAADRENPLVNDYFIEHHPAVVRLVGLAVAAAGAVPVSMCGELAHRLDSLPDLLNLGIRTLSVAPPLVPGVKEAVRQLLLEPISP